MFIKSTILFFLFTTVANKRYEWMERLANYIEEEANLVNQIIILQSVNEKDKTWKIENMLFSMLAKFPSRVINFKSESVQDQLSKLPIDDPQTNLFVLQHYQNEDQDFSQLSEPITFVSNISETRSRPKCLIVSFENVKFVKKGKLLRRMWSHDFLDVTVVSISSAKTNRLSTNDYQLTAVYHYNPHTNVTTRTRKSKFELFPDKTQNLKKYPINVLFQSYPPEVFLPTDTSVNKEISGIGWSKIKSLSKAMNFRMMINLQNGSSYLDCRNKYNSTGVYPALIHRKIEFLGMEFQRFGACDETFYEWGIGILDTKIVLVVPVLAKESYILKDKWAILRWFSIISLPFIIWLGIRLGHVYSIDLQLMHLIQIILGLTVPRVPQKSRERIIFAVMIITCTLYSSMIYTALTDIGLQRKITYSLETIDDVLLSNFPTVVLANIAKLLENFGNNRTRLLVERALKVHHNDPVPLIHQVYATKNVTCIAFSTSAKFLLQDRRDRCDMPTAKLLENDFIVRTVSGTVMAARSPYVKRVNVLLQRLIQSGVTEKWKHSYDQKLPKHVDTSFSCFNRSMESQEILWKLFFIIIIGYSLSILMFFMEMFVLYRLKCIARNFKVAKYLPRRSRRKN